MGTLAIAMILGGATGWVVCGYVYSQLSTPFKETKPLIAAAVAGGLSGIIGLAVISLIVHIMST
jgi:hypothetical protein